MWRYPWADSLQVNFKKLMVQPGKIRCICLFIYWKGSKYNPQELIEVSKLVLQKMKINCQRVNKRKKKCDTSIQSSLTQARVTCPESNIGRCLFNHIWKPSLHKKKNKPNYIFHELRQLLAILTARKQKNCPNKLPLGLFYPGSIKHFTEEIILKLFHS